MTAPKFKKGDKFICEDCPQFGVGIITAVNHDFQNYYVFWEKVGGGDRYFSDNIIPEAVFYSPLFQELK